VQLDSTAVRNNAPSVRQRRAAEQAGGEGREASQGHHGVRYYAEEPKKGTVRLQQVMQAWQVPIPITHPPQHPPSAPELHEILQRLGQRVRLHLRQPPPPTQHLCGSWGPAPDVAPGLLCTAAK
jgi:hypothetical protein